MSGVDRLGSRNLENYSFIEQCLNNRSMQYVLDAAVGFGAAAITKRVAFRTIPKLFNFYNNSFGRMRRRKIYILSPTDGLKKEISRPIPGSDHLRRNNSKTAKVEKFV